MMTQRKTFYQRSALFSLLAPLMALGLLVLGKFAIPAAPGQYGMIVALGIGALQMLVLISGLILGIVALVNSGKVGGDGIVGKAISGVVGCAFLLVVPYIVYALFSKPALEEVKQQELEQQRLLNPDRPDSSSQAE